MQRRKRPLGWSKILSDRTIAGLFSFRLAHTTCIGVIWAFLPVFADTEFSMSASAIGVLVMIGVFVSGAIQVPMGYLADRFNRKFMVVSGGVVAACAVYTFTFATGYWDMFAASVAFGLGGGIAMPSLMASAVLKGSRSDAMGSVISLLTVAHSLGMLLGSILAGIMMDWFVLRQAFFMVALLMALGTILFALLTIGKNLNTGAAVPTASHIPEG